MEMEYCAATGKRTYASPQAAHFAQGKAQGNARRRHRRERLKADKAYKCKDCSLWHLTSTASPWNRVPK